ncbi:hypothetical protein SmJEL517_g00710 [Synchytrium microbalum]|uniref:Superoxide dismutase 1 copper chaperone n=1 Tax=Synchytrium microbalum TaxID=1806994 RepID=A0A507CIU9_9FUNG|nr:uncharacterized protein SmJEL517_g00710 [Synchytrium microbalum]TPX37675.1 hypothetical protein SmJEL517_g00710 [Synchytrium microbalum]
MFTSYSREPSMLSKEITTEFAVSMECVSCTESVKKELAKNPRVSNIEISLADQRVVSTTPPSHIYHTLRNIGRTVVFRGVTGRQNLPNSAAVSIFEHFPGVKPGQWAQHDNRGLARLVQVDDDTCMVDITCEGLEAGKIHSVNIRECGDISRGALSTGEVYVSLGQMNVDDQGRGDLVAESRLKIWDVVGRSIVVEPVERPLAVAHADSVCGIIARSAGLFENVKRS